MKHHQRPPQFRVRCFSCNLKCPWPVEKEYSFQVSIHCCDPYPHEHKMAGEIDSDLNLADLSDKSHQEPISPIYDETSREGLDMMIVEGALVDEGEAFRFENDSDNEDEDDEVIGAGGIEHAARRVDNDAEFTPGEEGDAVAAPWTYFEDNMDDLESASSSFPATNKANAGEHESVGDANSTQDIVLTRNLAQITAPRWKEMAETALGSPTTLANLQRLISSRESDGIPSLRTELQAKVSMAEAFTAKAKKMVMDSPSIQDLHQLAEEGTAVNVELKILDHIKDQLSKAEALQLKISTTAEQQSHDIRALRALLAELDRSPVVIPVGTELRAKWKVVQAWFERVRVLLSASRRTRTATSDRQHKPHASVLQELLDEGLSNPLLRDRPEISQVQKQQSAAKRWMAEARSALADRESLALETLLGLLEKAGDLPVQCGEERALRAQVWLLQASAAASERPQLAALQELTASEDAEGEEGVEALRGVLREKQAKAEAWTKRARVVMSEKRPAEAFRRLLSEAAGLAVETEEEFLLQFHVESAEAWQQRAQAALSADKGDAKALKALVRESDRIAVCMDEVGVVERRAEELERQAEEEEEEADECNWAQCDGCQKWRRLGPEQVVNDDDPFYCIHAGKSCEEAEDEWDEEEEEVTATGEACQGDELDDVPLSHRRFLAVGSVVFAQFAYYPFWPAEVIDPEAGCRHLPQLLKDRKHGHVLVKFFGPGNKNWVDRRRIIPFHPDRDPNPKPIRSQSFKNAMTQATARFIPKKSAEQAKGDEEWKGDKKEEEEEDEDEIEEDEEDHGESPEKEPSGKRRRRGDKEWVMKERKPPGEGDKVPKGRGIRRISKEGESRKRARDPSGPGSEAKKKTPKPAPAPPPSQKKSSEGSYKDLCAVRDAEGTLKGRIVELTAQGKHDDVRREVRNMVTCCFLGALQLADPAPHHSVPRAATAVEQQLWALCGAAICADYRRRYRVLAMALRSRPPLRAAVLDGTLQPAALVDMSIVELDAYGKQKPKPPPPPPVKTEPAALPAALPSPRLVLERKAPAVLPSLQLPDVSTAEPSPPASPKEETKSGTPPTPTDGDPAPAPPAEPPSASPSPKTAPTAARHTDDGGRAAVAAAAKAAVGTAVWSGYVCKNHLPDTRVTAVQLSGAVVRCRLPAQLDIVGRIKLDALKQFLTDLERSRSRHKTVLRLDMHEQSKGDAAYRQLREHLEEQQRVGVINLGRDNQAYVLGPTAAREVLGLDGPGLHGVFVLRGEPHGKPASAPHTHASAPTDKRVSSSFGKAAALAKHDRTAVPHESRKKRDGAPPGATEFGAGDAASSSGADGQLPSGPESAPRKALDPADSGSVLMAALLGGTSVGAAQDSAASAPGGSTVPLPPAAATRGDGAPGVPAAGGQWGARGPTGVSSSDAAGGQPSDPRRKPQDDHPPTQPAAVPAPDPRQTGRSGTLSAPQPALLPGGSEGWGRRGHGQGEGHGEQHHHRPPADYYQRSHADGPGHALHVRPPAMPPPSHDPRGRPPDAPPYMSHDATAPPGEGGGAGHYQRSGPHGRGGADGYGQPQSYYGRPPQQSETLDREGSRGPPHLNGRQEQPRRGGPAGGRGEHRGGYGREQAEWSGQQHRPRDGERGQGRGGHDGDTGKHFSRGGGGGGRNGGGAGARAGDMAQSDVMSAFETIKAMLEKKEVPTAPAPPHPNAQHSRGPGANQNQNYQQVDQERGSYRQGGYPPSAGQPAEAADLRQLPTEDLIQQLLTMMPQQQSPQNQHPQLHHPPPPNNYGPPAQYAPPRADRDDKWKQQRRY